MGAFHAWNRCLPHLLLLARAHVESLILDANLKAVSACPDPECRKSLKVNLHSSAVVLLTVKSAANFTFKLQPT